MGNGTEIMPTAQAEKRTEIARVDTGPLAVFFDKDSFDLCWRSAKLLALSQLVPKRFQGRVEDCFLALSMARSLGVIPMMVMSEIYVVFGTPSMSGKMVAGLVNAAGIFDAPLNFRFSEERPVQWCEAYTTLNGQEYSVRVEWDAHVVASGWDRDKKEKDSDKTVPSKWRTMREQMFRYRAASWFGKSFAPQVMLGMQTREELEDEAGMMDRAVTIDARVPVAAELLSGSPTARMDAAAAALAKKAAEQDAAQVTAPNPAGPEFEPKAEPPMEPPPEPKTNGKQKPPRGKVVDKTLHIEGEEIVRLVHAIETSDKIGDNQTAADYVAQVLGLAVTPQGLTRQQAEKVLASLETVEKS